MGDEPQERGEAARPAVPGPGLPHPRPPGGPHHGGPPGIGQEGDERVGERARITAVDDVSGVAFPRGLGRATGTTRHHREPRRRRLQQRYAQPFDVEPASAGAARQG